MSDESTTARKNLSRYKAYVVGTSTFAWMPVFFLYMSSRVSMSEVLALEAIYYASVVTMELPSGYASDRFGRRPTLILSAAMLTASYVLFALSSTFAPFAVAQLLLASGLAFNSGTDTSYHLAVLQSAGMEEEYEEREAVLSSLTFQIGAAAALVGGAVGTQWLAGAYVISAVGALAALIAMLLATGVDEHAQTTGEPREHEGFFASLASVVGMHRDPVLGWLFAVSVAATVVNHVPYEFYQPYLGRMQSAPWPAEWVPLVAGVHLAMAQIVAAPAARRSAALSRRVGLMPTLIGSVALQVVIIAAMAFVVHPVVVALLVARSVPGGIQRAPMRASIAPRVDPSHRATLLSLHSLSGRLAFSGVLVALSASGVQELPKLLGWSFSVGAVLLILLALLAAALRPGRRIEQGAP